MGKILEMQLAEVITGSEMMEVVQNGESRKVALRNIVTKGDPGVKGDTGTAGKSAFQTAVANGFVGTEAEWLLSIKGAKGDPGTPGVKGDTGEKGLDGVAMPGTPGTPGVAGKSAYDVAQENGFVGNVDAWLASLKGTAGLSAYQTALDTGFVGTQAAWIASLKGVKGDPGVKGDTGTGLKGDPGIQGVPGVNGSVWYMAAGEPGPALGLINDLYFNTTTGAVYTKTDASTWTTQGSIVAKQLDRYDLKLGDVPAAAAGTTTNLDLSVAQSWVIHNSANRTLTFSAVPTGRSMTLVLAVWGNTGVLTWPASVKWSKGAVPALGTNKTIITMFWDGAEWIASAGATY